MLYKIIKEYILLCETLSTEPTIDGLNSYYDKRRKTYEGSRKYWEDLRKELELIKGE